MTIGDIRNDLKERFADRPTAEKSECLWECLDNAHMDEEWKQNCKTDNWWAEPTEILSHRPDFEQLKDFCEIRDKLLAKGGDMVNIPLSQPDEDTQAILKYGQFWNGVGAQKPICESDYQCYSNSCRIWAKEKDNPENDSEHEIHICIGFALSDCGMWENHCWLIEKDKMHQAPTIIETTDAPFIFPPFLYFGYVLDDYRATDLYYQMIDCDPDMEDVEGFKEPTGYNDYLDYFGGKPGFIEALNTDDFEIPSEPIQENER